MVVGERFAGVDAGRNIIEASLRPDGEAWKVQADEEGMTELAGRLRSFEPELIVMPANGTFELPLAGILATLGLRFALVQPRNLREFARAIGRVSRAEQSQAELLAHFAELVRPEAWPLSDELIRQLKDIRSRRNEILDILALEKNRSGSQPAVVQRDVQRHVRFLEKSVQGMDEEFGRLIRLSRIWR